MFRTRLADKAGMLFFYETPQEITMWTRNTYIPLDMVFIRADGIVHRIEAYTEPLSENIVASRGDVRPASNSPAARPAGWACGRATGSSTASLSPRATRQEVKRRLVGAAGFELATPCSQSRCSTRPSYAPTGRHLYHGR